MNEISEEFCCCQDGFVTCIINTQVLVFKKLTDFSNKNCNIWLVVYIMKDTIFRLLILLIFLRF